MSTESFKRKVVYMNVLLSIALWKWCLAGFLFFLIGWICLKTADAMPILGWEIPNLILMVLALLSALASAACFCATMCLAASLIIALL